MVSTTFDESSNISIELPQSSSEMLMKEDQNFDIWIDKDGLYYIEEQNFTRGVQSLLQSQSSKNPQTVLHVNADKETSHHHIVFLLDIATRLVFKSWCWHQDAEIKIYIRYSKREF